MIIEVSKDSDFSIHNIPFGIFQTNDKSPRAGVAIGEYIIDLEELSNHGVFDFDSSVLKKDTLNDFIALGKEKTIKVRTDIQEWLQDCNSIKASRVICKTIKCYNANASKYWRLYRFLFK